MRRFNYKEHYKQLEIMTVSIMASKLPKVKLNLKGLRDYARKKALQLPVFQMQKSNFLLKHKTNNIIYLPFILSGNFYDYSKLEKKKKYFETIVMFCLSFMSIVVTIASVVISNNQLSLNKIQTQIIVEQSKPIFIFSGREIDDTSDFPLHLLQVHLTCI